MKITLRLLEGIGFEAKNDDGNNVIYDSSPEFGGQGRGFRPMEAIMSSLGACAGIDLVHILRKGRREVTECNTTVTGTRRKEPLPGVFTDIHLHFEISGSFSEIAMNNAAKLSVEKYCSVGDMLKHAVNITYSVKKNNPSSEVCG